MIDAQVSGLKTYIIHGTPMINQSCGTRRDNTAKQHLVPAPNIKPLLPSFLSSFLPLLPSTHPGELGRFLGREVHHRRQRRRQLLATTRGHPRPSSRHEPRSKRQRLAVSRALSSSAAGAATRSSSRRCRGRSSSSHSSARARAGGPCSGPGLESRGSLTSAATTTAASSTAVTADLRRKERWARSLEESGGGGVDRLQAVSGLDLVQHWLVLEDLQVLKRPEGKKGRSIGGRGEVEWVGGGREGRT